MSERLGGLTVGVLIPALNEAMNLGDTIAGLPDDMVDTILVVDNGSEDATGDVASEAGAVVISEPKHGYGRACLAGIGWYREHPVEILLFLDADGADDPSMTLHLLEPIVTNEADLVIGSRLLGEREPGALPPHAAWGNRLAVFLIKKLFGHEYTDLGPFRAIRWSALEKLKMADEDYGWTVEMQVKALKKGIRTKEIAVPYRRRKHGKSKVSGTVRGTVLAGWKIITTIIKLRLAGNN
jgi:glycosyltransferase involved in cell wall biosynthesis